MISTRGRYSLRIMLDLAERPQGGYTPMKEVAARQEISLKYIEKIVPLLTKAGFIEGVHGKGGGYRLCRAPEDITAGEVLMWKEYYRLTNEYFDKISLADLLGNEAPGDYVI